MSARMKKREDNHKGKIWADPLTKHESGRTFHAWKDRHPEAKSRGGQLRTDSKNVGAMTARGLSDFSDFPSTQAEEEAGKRKKNSSKLAVERPTRAKGESGEGVVT